MKPVQARGFTLVELLVTMVVLGILVTGTVRYIVNIGESFRNASRWSEISSGARLAVERINREVRDAVPNSIRVGVGSPVGSPRRCIEFLPIVAAGNYLDLHAEQDATGVTLNTALPFPVDGNVVATGIVFDKDKFSVLKPVAPMDDPVPSFVAVAPQDASDLYQVADGLGSPDRRMFKFVSSAPNGTSTVMLDITKDSLSEFKERSDNERIYFAGEPVSYCVLDASFDDSEGQLRRYTGYPITAAQFDPSSGVPAGTQQLVIAEDLLYETDVFTYESGALERKAIVSLLFKLQQSDQSMTLNHELQIRNIP